MERQMRRYEVPADDQAHDFDLSGRPVAVAHKAGSGGTVVELWAEWCSNGQPMRRFRVFGTGQDIPDGWGWVASTPRDADTGLVWHLYELPAAAGESTP